LVRRSGGGAPAGRRGRDGGHVVVVELVVRQTHEVALVELLRIEADRTDEELAATGRKLLEETRERRAAFAGDTLGDSWQREADSLFGEKHRDLFPLLQCCAGNQERDGHPLAVLEAGRQVDDDLVLRSHPSRLDVISVLCDTFADLAVGSLHLGMIAVDVLACETEELVVVRAFEMMAARTVDRSHVSSLEAVCVEVSNLA